MCEAWDIVVLGVFGKNRFIGKTKSCYGWESRSKVFPWWVLIRKRDNLDERWSWSSFSILGYPYISCWKFMTVRRVFCKIYMCHTYYSLKPRADFFSKSYQIFIPTVPTNTLCLDSWAICHLQIFIYSHPYHSHQELFSISQSFSWFGLRQESNERGSFMRSDTALISSCFSNVWTWIAALAITDSSLLRLRKMVYCRY